MERNLNKAAEKRQQLKALSVQVKPLVEGGEYETINEALIDSYTKGKHKVFKSYRAWQDEGKQVKKGEKAFLLWAKPKPIGKQETEKTETEENKDEFFPVAYLFSNAQVEPKKGERKNG